MSKFYFDSETFLIAPGIQAPPAVCFSACINTNGSAWLMEAWGDETPNSLRVYLESNTLVGHHVAFDMAVICANWPELAPLVFQAYSEDRVTCTETRQKLIDIGRGRFKGDKKLSYNLGDVSQRCGGPVVDKSDPWRLKYGTLYKVPLEQWPEEARRYALLDAEATRAVYLAQESDSRLLADQYNQARAAFWIELMRCWGIATNKMSAEKYIEYVQRTLQEDRRLCMEVGLVRPDGTKDTKKATDWMLKLCDSEGEQCPMTEGGQPSLSEEAIEEYGDYVLEAYQRYANANARTKRATRLLNSPIQARFDVLVNTGRTSCSQGDKKTKKGAPLEAPSAWGAQLQNPSKDKGFREVFVARPGHALVSIDYDALELHTWSQVCIWLFGHSDMADVINQGRDAHTELAAELLGITAAQAYVLKKTDESFNNGPRFFSKAGNFGFLGGMGGLKFCKSLVKQAVHQGDPATIAQAKAYTVEQATELKAAFVRKWSEADQYFRHVSGLVRRGKVVVPGTQETKEQRACEIEHFVSKRIRGGCFYTQACNSFFQGLAADLAKDAMWRCTVEMYNDRESPLYGSRLVNFVHDEGIFEIPLERLHEAAYRARDIMCQTGEAWCPSLKFTAEPAAMLAWSKSAKTVLKDGRLVPWVA